MSVRLILIRHAQSSANLSSHIICGRSDDNPLSDRGIVECGLLRRRLNQRPRQFDYIYSSSAQRAIQTAQRVTAQESVIVDDMLVEQSQGDWEGRVREEVHTAEVKAAMAARNIDFASPNGESLADVAKRAAVFIDTHFLEWANRARTLDRIVDVAVFTHGGVIRGTIYHLIGVRAPLVWRIRIDNSSLSAFIIDSDRSVSLQCINDASPISAP